MLLLVASLQTGMISSCLLALVMSASLHDFMTVCLHACRQRDTLVLGAADVVLWMGDLNYRIQGTHALIKAVIDKNLLEVSGCSHGTRQCMQTRHVNYMVVLSQRRLWFAECQCMAPHTLRSLHADSMSIVPHRKSRSGCCCTQQEPHVFCYTGAGGQ